MIYERHMITNSVMMRMQQMETGVLHHVFWKNSAHDETARRPHVEMEPSNFLNSVTLQIYKIAMLDHVLMRANCLNVVMVQCGVMKHVIQENDVMTQQHPVPMMLRYALRDLQSVVLDIFTDVQLIVTRDVVTKYVMKMVQMIFYELRMTSSVMMEIQEQLIVVPIRVMYQPVEMVSLPIMHKCLHLLIS